MLCYCRHGTILSMAILKCFFLTTAVYCNFELNDINLYYNLFNAPVLNKCLTVLVNSLIWDEHAQPEGIFCLFICIAGGMAYQQAPMKEDQEVSPVTLEISSVASTNVDEEMEGLTTNNAVKRRS